MPDIQTKTGDATKPTPGQKGIIIAHIVNNRGGWGAGFVLAVNKISTGPQYAYRSWAKDNNDDIPLGDVQFVEAKPGLFIANMCAQNGMKRSDENPCLVDYNQLKRCLRIVFYRALALDFDVHMPAGMGSGLAGGDQDTIHQIIKEIANECETKSQVAIHVPGRTLSITLWEYNDKKSDSYIPTQNELTSDDSFVDNMSQAEQDVEDGNTHKRDITEIETLG